MDTPTIAPTRDVVEAAYRAFANRDVPALMSLLSPNVVWSQPDNPLIPSAGTRHGLDGVGEWLAIGNATEEVLSLEPKRIVVEGDTAAVIGYLRVTARRTGRSYAMDFVHVITVEDGLVTRFEEFFDTWTAAQAFNPG
jgi:uncharacterized protein